MGKHYIGPFDAMAKNHKYQPHEAPFHEEIPMLLVPNFYYILKDIVFEAAKNKGGLS